MTIKSGFFNSSGGDRKYDALDISSIFDGVIEDGVFATLGNAFTVTAGSGLQVIVDTGKAWFNHTWTINDAALPLTIDSADVTLDRIDAVVLEVNNSDSIRANSIKIVKGSPASSPSKPSLTNSADVHQHALAYVRVTKGAASISAQNIEIVVGKSETPFVTGPLSVIEIDAIFAQWEAEFDYWFDNVKTNLEGDVAANLQRQIDALKLTPETAAYFGLGEDAVPDDAFSFLGQYNQHWWHKYAYAEETPVLDTPSDLRLGGGPYSWSEFTISYSDALTVTGTTGTLKDPKTITLSYSDHATANELKGKYLSLSGSIYFVDPSAPNATRTRDTEAGAYNVYIESGKLLKVNPAGPSGDPTYEKSSNRSAYPDYGVKDSYFYEYLGQPLNNSIETPKIVVGTYTGTGKYGVNSPNKINLDFPPKALILRTQSLTGDGYSGTDTWLFTKDALQYSMTYGASSGNRTATMYFDWEDSYVSWYTNAASSNSPDIAQFNVNGDIYYYVAIG